MYDWYTVPSFVDVVCMGLPSINLCSGVIQSRDLYNPRAEIYTKQRFVLSQLLVVVLPQAAVTVQPQVVL